MDRNTIGVIGCGNMGSSIIEQIKAFYSIYVFDKDKAKLKNLSQVHTANTNRELAGLVDVILLAVKPQDFDYVLDDIKDDSKEKLMISIAAGIDTAYIERKLNAARVIRAMPNIGVKIGESVTSLCKGSLTSDKDLEYAKNLFEHFGNTKVIAENMINAATAISGSGPAYIFYTYEEDLKKPDKISDKTKNEIVERLKSAAMAVGFKSDMAIFFAVSTTNCSIDLVKKTKIAPSDLRIQVTSKGGTTEAALEILKNGLSWDDAARAALNRANELSKRLTR